MVLKSNYKCNCYVRIPQRIESPETNVRGTSSFAANHIDSLSSSLFSLTLLQPIANPANTLNADSGIATMETAIVNIEGEL